MGHALRITAALLAATAGAAAGAKDLLIADFEGQDYGDWKVEGEAFGPGPARGTLPHQMRVSGFLGKGLVNSFYQGDATTGTLTSPPFAIQRDYVNFLVGGGGYAGQTCINLLVDGKVVRTATGPNTVSGGTEKLEWATWDVRKLRGKSAVIQIVDRVKGGWGHINVDHIVQSDTPRAMPTGDPEAEQRRRMEQAKRALARLETHGVQQILFAVRKVDPDGHWYANFSTWSNNPDRRMYHDGGRLCRLDLETGEVTTLVDDPTGGVRDPQMHYDGKKILFSYRKGGQPYYHLYEIRTDGTELRQLTDGPYDDIEPAYLPDGDIVFCSSRCNRMVNCYFVRVAVVHRCDGDGGHIRPLSANIEQDNTPWVLPDGRVLYMRWEYVDRSQVAYHHLWTMNPDGTEQMVYYGNQNPSTVMIDAKPIPGTGRVVASFSPGHGRREHAGVVTIVDPAAGPDTRPFARAVSRKGFWRDPYPLSEDCFLVAGDTDIRVMNGRGETALVYDLPAADRQAGLKVHEPRPVRPRPRERVRPDLAKPSQGTGRLVLADLYNGRNMSGVRPGEVTELLVLETLPKPVNFSGGWEPITYGGSFTLERLVGTVPVEPDGSAYFELPALRAFFFVALDADDLSVKRMQSFLTLQPGETMGCVGCHEERTKTPPATTGRLLALRRPPSPVRPIEGVPNVIDFPRDVQPILDRHCVACHGYDATRTGGPRAGGVVLTGDRGPWYSHSYFLLTARGQVSDGRNLRRGNYPPRRIGSSASPLLGKIDGGHHDVTLSAHERKLIRLWIDSAAAYPGTYAALGSGMVGGQGWGEPTKDVLARRCNGCHRGKLALPQNPGDRQRLGTTGTIKPRDPRLRLSHHIVFNLSRPAKSLFLLAPLSKDAGGYGICGSKASEEETEGEPTPVFAGAQDPDYQILRKAIQATAAHLERIKRFDMPGFRPNEHYIREMKFYGVLPDSLGPEDPIDVYATDQAYWRSLWYTPRPRTSIAAGDTQ